MDSSIAKKVLVTGATGFLGHHLCRRLVHDGCDVSVFRRPTSNADALSGLDVKEFTGEITDPKAVDVAMQGQDVVIHAAAHMGYWHRLKKRNDQWKTNVEGTQNLLRAGLHVDLTRFVFVSTITALGIPEHPESPANEMHEFNLQNSSLNYPISKHRAEMEVLDAVSKGLDAIIVNPAWIFGRFGRRYRGSELIENVRKKRLVPYFPGGINIVHIDDVVDGITSALGRGIGGQRYILAGNNLSYRTICETVSHVFDLKRTYVRIPRSVTWTLSRILEPVSSLTGQRPKITYDLHFIASRYQYYDATKSRDHLEFNPRSFKEVVREYRTFVEERDLLASTNST